MPNTVVRENNLQFNFTRYFRGGAEDVEIGSIGRKRTPVLGVNKLEVKGQLPMGNAKSAKTVVADIDFIKTKKAVFSRRGKVAAKGQTISMSGSAMFEGLRTGKLRLVKIGILPNDMRDLANSSSSILRELINDGDRARIAHEIFVVMKAELANSFGVSGEVRAKVRVSAQGVEVEGSGRASASVSSKTRVVLAPGTTFAYHLLKLKWNAKAKRKKTRIVDVREDQAGMG